jgi:hypothetical protein
VIASSPRRNTSETWCAITDLIADTLDRSPSLNRPDVEEQLVPLDQVARMLISAGHLETHPVVLVAEDLWVEISTVSGTAALTLDENINPVPGGATATDWTLHVPQVEPMAKLVRTAVKGHDHLSADEPTELTKEAARSGGPLDLEALALWAQEDR